nr:hypothetical protein [Polynucleobacter necessarius]
MELAARLISKLDIRTQEVLIEAFIVEATDDWQRELGVRLGAYTNSATGNTGRSSTGDVNGINSNPGALNLGTDTGSIFNQPVTGLANPFGLGYLYQTTSNALKVEVNRLGAVRSAQDYF